MIEKHDEIETLVNSQMEKEAEMIEQEVTQGIEGEPGAERINRIKSNLDEQIRQKEVEKLIAQLPEEERKALEIGKEILKDKDRETASEEAEKKVKYRKKKRKMYIGIAAALTVFLAVGVTSLGGAERVVEMLKQSIGQREVTKVTSGENVIKSEGEQEEDAYQKIKDELGIDPVRISARPQQLVFEDLHIDQQLQTAELLYSYNEQSVGYYINLSFADSSWGIDAEDKIVKRWNEELSKCSIEITEYITPKSNNSHYLAKYKYKQVEYFLSASMPKNEFMKIIKNLHFK